MLIVQKSVKKIIFGYLQDFKGMNLGVIKYFHSLKQVFSMLSVFVLNYQVKEPNLASESIVMLVMFRIHNGAGFIRRVFLCILCRILIKAWQNQRL